MTVRRRLLIGMMAVLAALIAAVGVAEILVLRHALYQRSAQGLRNELSVLAAAPGLPLTTGDTGSGAACSGLTSSFPPRPAPKGTPSGPAPSGGAGPGPAGIEAVAQALAARSIATAVAGPDGSLLFCATAGRQGHQSGFSVPTSLPARLRTNAGYVTLHDQGHHLLAISQALGPDQAILVTDIADDDTAVRVVLLVTVLGGLVALVIAAALSGPLLRTGLAPLRRVARTADAVADGDLDQRADLHGSADEVGQLGAAFDRMVDRLTAALAERDTVVEDLRARDQVMRRFLADASHELRTPLTAIRGGTQVLRRGSAHDPADVAEALGHIQTQTERMSRLIDDLLVLSRYDSGQPSPPRTPLDLGALVGDHLRHWTALAPDHVVTATTEAAWVAGDGDALTRVVANLVDNAGKYSPPRTAITIAVTATATADRVILSVTDRGPGVPEADRDRVFERFYRGDRARSRSTGGAGLGLAIVAEIVHGHDGVVRVEAGEGGGTTMVVDLPRRPGEP